MRDYFIWAGIALCLFSLWQIARRDWVRLTSMSRQVRAEVTGHRKHHDSDGESWAAIYRFSAEGGEHEVVDQVFSSRPSPPVGSLRELTYPFGRPDLARPPRPWLWLAIYGLLIGLTGVLFSAWMGWLKD